MFTEFFEAGSQTTAKVEIVTEQCIACGIVFGLPKSYRQQLVENHKVFYCPNGHGQHYNESQKDREIKQLRQKLEEEAKAAEYWRKSARAEEVEHKSTKRSLSATKGVLTKTKKRVANGVCPCCNRTFQNLQRHMSDQHPEYAEE